MDQSTADTILLIDMDQSERIIHVLNRIATGLGDIKTAIDSASIALNTASTIVSGLQGEIRDVVKELTQAKQSSNASGQLQFSSASEASHPRYTSSFDRAHQDLAQIRNQITHFKKQCTQNNERQNPQIGKSKAERTKRPFYPYPKSEFDRVSSRDISLNLSLDNRISFVNRSPINFVEQEESQPWEAQQSRPQVFSFQKSQAMLKSQQEEKEKNKQFYGVFSAVKQYPLKLQPLSLEEVVSQRQSLAMGQHKVQNFINFARHTMLGMNTTTSDRFGTEIDIVKYIQCEASKLSSKTQGRSEKQELKQVISTAQKFLMSRFNKNIKRN